MLGQVTTGDAFNIFGFETHPCPAMRWLPGRGPRPARFAGGVQLSHSGTVGAIFYVIGSAFTHAGYPNLAVWRALAEIETYGWLMLRWLLSHSVCFSKWHFFHAFMVSTGLFARHPPLPR